MYVVSVSNYKVELVLSSDSHEVNDVGHQEVLVFKSPTSGQSLIIEKVRESRVCIGRSFSRRSEASLQYMS